MNSRKFFYFQFLKKLDFFGSSGIKIISSSARKSVEDQISIF